MKRYFMNYEEDAITTENNEEDIAELLSCGYIEVDEDEYERIYQRLWKMMVNWRN